MSDPRDPELKPCPFCGGPAGLEEWAPDGEHSIFSAGCPEALCPGRQETAFDQRDEAVSRWNRRSIPTPGALVGEPLTREEVERAADITVEGRGPHDQFSPQLWLEASAIANGLGLWRSSDAAAVLYKLAWDRVRPPRDTLWREAMEAAARACDRSADTFTSGSPYNDGYAHGARDSASICANRIRSLVPPASPPTPRGGER